MNSINKDLKDIILFKGSQFDQWTALNDTIMGGSSMASCVSNKDGLLFEGEVIEKNGGFVSCRSPLFSNPFDLSIYSGIRVEIDGDGRTYKLALSCDEKIFSINNLYKSNLRWVASFTTNNTGTTKVDLLYENFEPAIRAKPIKFYSKFNQSAVNGFQLLHSKFGQPGKLNKEFKSGRISILLRSISAFI